MSVTIRTERLVKSFRRRRVVDGVSIEVTQGEVVGLLGQNGAGKTTTFYMVVGLLRPDSGSVWLGSRNVSRMPMYRRARAGIGYLPQEPSVFRRLTVEENLSLVLQMQRRTCPRFRVACGEHASIGGQPCSDRGADAAGRARQDRDRHGMDSTGWALIA